MHTTFPKPVKGAALLASRQRTAERKAAEQKHMQKARRRDCGICRWPAVGA